LSCWRQRWAILFIVIGSPQLRRVVITFIRLAPTDPEFNPVEDTDVNFSGARVLVHDRQEDDRGQDGKDNKSEDSKQSVCADRREHVPVVGHVRLAKRPSCWRYMHHASTQNLCSRVNKSIKMPSMLVA
jgi:hypothetical protein